MISRNIQHIFSRRATLNISNRDQNLRFARTADTHNYYSFACEEKQKREQEIRNYKIKDIITRRYCITYRRFNMPITEQFIKIKTDNINITKFPTLLWCLKAEEPVQGPKQKKNDSFFKYQYIHYEQIK